MNGSRNTRLDYRWHSKVQGSACNTLQAAESEPMTSMSKSYCSGKGSWYFCVILLHEGLTRFGIGGAP